MNESDKTSPAADKSAAIQHAPHSPGTETESGGQERIQDGNKPATDNAAVPPSPVAQTAGGQDYTQDGNKPATDNAAVPPSPAAQTACGQDHTQDGNKPATDNAAVPPSPVAQTACGQDHTQDGNKPATDNAAVPPSPVAQTACRQERIQDGNKPATDNAAVPPSPAVQTAGGQDHTQDGNKPATDNAAVPPSPAAQTAGGQDHIQDGNKPATDNAAVPPSSAAQTADGQDHTQDGNKPATDSAAVPPSPAAQTAGGQDRIQDGNKPATDNAAVPPLSAAQTAGGQERIQDGNKPATDNAAVPPSPAAQTAGGQDHIQDGNKPAPAHNQQIHAARVVQGGTIRLANARQNQPFCADIRHEALCRGLQALRLVQDDSTGLTLDENGVLRGIPTRPGEYTLQLYGQRSADITVAITLQWLVNPDPKTLWHNIEPTSALFRKPHRAFLCAEDKRVRLTAARIRGRSHAHKGSFCEDDIALFARGEQYGYLGMVADGAGSSAFSRLASQVLCESLPRHLCAELDRIRQNGTLSGLQHLLCQDAAARAQGLGICGNILANAVKRALTSVLEYTQLGLRHEKSAAYRGLTIKDLYSTCLVFWVLPLADGRWSVASYWVGDGALVIQHGDKFTLLGTPDSGAFSGQTRFLTREEVTDTALSKRLKTGIYADLQSIWAMTDGITDAKFAAEQQLEEQQLWQALTAELLPALDSAAALYEWLGFWSQGNHDDRSLCVFRRKEGVAA